MTKEFVPYELAVKLKELGFDEQCFGYHLCENSASGVDLKITTEWIDLLPYDSSSCKAPLYQQAFRWFREKYNLNYWVKEESQVRFSWRIYKGDGYATWDCHPLLSNTYEEAELACLTKLIEIVEQTKN